MDPDTLSAAARRLPLVGRPRPACPSLIDRATEVGEIAAKAAAGNDDSMAEAAHALNKAALIASDCGLPELARQWCWRHINVYRRLNRLTILHASYLLEPVLNLARLQIRARDGQPALQLLQAMYQSVVGNTDLTIDGQSLLMSNLSGPQEELQRLRQWTWMHYLNEGIRIHVLAGRWPDAVRHATSLRGIGLHPMEGRQADIVARLLDRDPDGARTVLDASTITQPWEHQVKSCLAVMCSAPSTTSMTIETMIERLREPYEPIEGYAVYRARWGLTAATLAAANAPAAAQDTLLQASIEVLDTSDGYAAREILGHKTSLQIGADQREALIGLVHRAGLGTGTMPADVLSMLTEAVSTAERALAAAIS